MERQRQRPGPPPGATGPGEKPRQGDTGGQLMPEGATTAHVGIAGQVERREELARYIRAFKELLEMLSVPAEIIDWVNEIDEEFVGPAQTSGEMGGPATTLPRDTRASTVVGQDSGDSTAATVARTTVARTRASLSIKEPAPDDQLFQDLTRIHDWLVDARYGFMFSAPPGKRPKDPDYQEWLEEWSKVLFDYAALGQKHVVDIPEIINKKPFSELRERQKTVIEVAKRLVSKKLAEWLKKKERLRVYWRTLEEWADEIYDWAFKNVVTEPMFIYDFRDCGEHFSTLPEEDFRRIFSILESRGRGKLVKASNGKEAFVFDHGT